MPLIAIFALAAFLPSSRCNGCVEVYPQIQQACFADVSVWSTSDPPDYYQLQPALVDGGGAVASSLARLMR